MKPEEMQKLSIQKFLEVVQKEAQKLSDRDLLIKTYGTMEWLKGVMGNGGGVLEEIRKLWKGQAQCVTYRGLTLTVGIISAIFVVVGALLIIFL